MAYWIKRGLDISEMRFCPFCGKCLMAEAEVRK